MAMFPWYLSDMWRSTFKIGEAQLRSVTEIAPKSLLLCAGFCADTKS